MTQRERDREREREREIKEGKVGYREIEQIGWEGFWKREREKQG